MPVQPPGFLSRSEWTALRKNHYASEKRASSLRDCGSKPSGFGGSPPQSWKTCWCDPDMEIGNGTWKTYPSERPGQA
jgi:hypothetical protein